jgi:hypothetical protein
MNAEAIKKWEDIFYEERKNKCKEDLMCDLKYTALEVLEWLKNISDVPVAFGDYSFLAESVIKNEIQKNNARISAITKILRQREEPEEMIVKNN